MFDELTALLRGTFLGSHGLLYWPFAAVYLVMGTALLVGRGAHRERGLLRALFPAEVYGHASFRTDLKLWAVTLVLTRLGLFVLVGVGVAAFSVAFTAVLRPLVQLVHTPSPAGPGLVDRAAFTLAAIVLFDLGYFLAHRASHRWPLLWAFHRVHHAAEHLNPLTAGRLHPVDYFVAALLGALMGAVATAGFTLWHGTAVQALTVANLSVVYALFLVLAHFRHSHIEIGFGSRASALLVSPAMHRVHHSRERRHYDVNFGLIFSFWDRLFGAHYVPRPNEPYRLGIDDARFGSDRPLLDHLLLPFADVARLLRTPSRLFRHGPARKVARPGPSASSSQASTSTRAASSDA